MTVNCNTILTKKQQQTNKQTKKQNPVVDQDNII